MGFQVHRRGARENWKTVKRPFWLRSVVPLGAQNQAGRRTPKMGSQVKLGMSGSQDKEMSELESHVRHKAEPLNR